MTGRVEKVATPLKPGRIATNSGPTQFRFTYRKTAETSGRLTVGQLVSFELAQGTTELAVGVRRKGSVGATDRDETTVREIRYQGFTQTEGVRSYKFQAWRTGEENQEAIVTVNLALFRKHGISIQEGPGMCLRLVKAEFQESALADPTNWTRALSDKEMLDHCSRQAAPKNTRRKGSSI